MIRLAGLTEYRHVTDRQTDGRTDRHLATFETKAKAKGPEAMAKARKFGLEAKVWP